MKPKEQRAKIAKIIRNLDEIILSETERTYGLSVLKACRNQLQKLLVISDGKGKVTDYLSFFLAVMKLVEVLHFFVNSRGSK